MNASACFASIHGTADEIAEHASVRRAIRREDNRRVLTPRTRIGKPAIAVCERLEARISLTICISNYVRRENVRIFLPRTMYYVGINLFLRAPRRILDDINRYNIHILLDLWLDNVNFNRPSTCVISVCAGNVEHVELHGLDYSSIL